MQRPCARPSGSQQLQQEGVLVGVRLHSGLFGFVSLVATFQIVFPSTLK